MISPVADLVPPRYGTASLAELVPSAVAALTGVGVDHLGLGAPAAVIVLVVDGLGAELLDANAEFAPFLSSRSEMVLDAAFPTTTATSLTTIGTGRPPGQHGLVGFTIGLPDEDQPLNLLSWRVGLRGGGHDARQRHVPEALQPRPTALETAASLGIGTTVVVHPDFLDSGLTRAGLRGGQRIGAVGLDATLDAALAATAGSAPALVYVHHGDLDSAGHSDGPGSERWCEELIELDRGVERAAHRLAPGSLLLVTADHGMVTVPEEDTFELSHADGLLEGVRVLAGEPRVRHLHTIPGATADVVAAWRSELADRATVLPREDAITRGWFGPVEPALATRIGDVVVVAHHGSLPHHRVDAHHGRQLGQHGGMSTSEVRVPLKQITGHEEDHR